MLSIFESLETKKRLVLGKTTANLQQVRQSDFCRVAVSDCVD
jgi:hypothetical protein